MAGISSKAAGKMENKIKYNSYELNSDFDVNLYESFYRTHDPQIGRFLQIDSKSNDFESPYCAMGNNPILRNDILGDTAVVGPQDQQAVLNDLNNKTYKENYFEFNEQNQLQFTHYGEMAAQINKKYYGDDEKTKALSASLNGMSSLITSKEITGIIYTNDPISGQFQDRNGNTTNNAKATDQGGEFTITQTDLNSNGVTGAMNLGGLTLNNLVLINPDVVTNVPFNISSISNPTPTQIIEAKPSGQISVPFARNNLLMHGIGHVLHQSSSEQSKVIVFDNANRILSGSPPNRDLDGSHKNK